MCKPYTSIKVGNVSFAQIKANILCTAFSCLYFGVLGIDSANYLQMVIKYDLLKGLLSRSSNLSPMFHFCSLN